MELTEGAKLYPNAGNGSSAEAASLLNSIPEVGLPEIDASPGRQWYAAYTCARHEKRVAELLGRRSVESFLPLYETVHRWKNGPARVRLPLFPGYVFVRIALKDRLDVLGVPSVVRLVGFNGQPAALPESEIEAIRRCIEGRQFLQPHPYLRAGQKVLIKSGPLQGLTGILVRKKGAFRVVISIDLIARSVSADLGITEIEPQKPR